LLPSNLAGLHGIQNCVWAAGAARQAMVSHCANPGCGESFRFLGEGRLFLENPSAALDFNRQQLVERCLWLCKKCSQNYEIRFENHIPTLVPHLHNQLRNSRGA